MLIGEIKAVLEGGSRVIVSLPGGKEREYGLSRCRRMVEKPKVGMAIVQANSGHLTFFANTAEAQRSLEEIE